MTSILLFFGEKTVDSNPYLDAKYTLRPEAFGAVLFFYGTDGDYLSYLSHTEALIVACSDGSNSIENICSIISHIFACDTVDAKKKIEDVFHRLNSGKHEMGFADPGRPMAKTNYFIQCLTHGIRNRSVLKSPKN